jgi:hypothetical protein
MQYPPVDQLTDKHVEADNMQFLLLKFGLWLAATPIPHSSDRDNETFEPKVDNPRYIVFGTLDKYYSKTKETLKNKFPDHDYWKSEEWWTELRQGLSKAATRNKIRGDLAFGDPKTRCLYKDNNANDYRLVPFSQNPDSQEWVD